MLRSVETGAEVAITRNGKVVARLVPERDPIRKLDVVGVHPAERSGPIPAFKPSRVKLRRSLTRAVLEDRE